MNGTEYSKSTISRHLREMEGAGDVVRIQVGKQKLVFLPEHVPEAARHPFETHTDAADAPPNADRPDVPGSVGPTDSTVGEAGVAGDAEAVRSGDRRQT